MNIGGDEFLNNFGSMTDEQYITVMDYFNEYNPGILLITHYERLLDYIKPTHVHILNDGKIVRSGDYSLVKEIEKNGFKEINVKKVSSIGTCAIKEIMKHE